MGCGGGDEGAGEVLASGKGGAGHVGELLDGGVVQAVDVGDDDRVRIVVADGHHGEGGHPLVEGADAAGHDDEHVAVLNHVLLAVTQVGGIDHLVTHGVDAMPEHLGNHTDDVAASLVNGGSGDVHQAGIGAAIEQGVAVLTNPSAQVAGQQPVFLVQPLLRTAVNDDLHIVNS